MARSYFSEQEIDRLQQAFEQIKAENDRFLIEHTDRAFVHTSVYKKAQIHGRCLLVGRKGSGKTALLFGHEFEHKKDYYLSKHVNLDALPFAQLFSFFFEDFDKSRKKFEEKFHPDTDLPHIIEPEKVSYYAWSNSIICMSILLCITQIQDDKLSVDILSPEEIKVLDDTAKAIESLIGGKLDKKWAEKGIKSVVFYPLLVYFYRTIQEAIEEALAIDTPNLSVVLAAITRLVLGTLDTGVTPKFKEAGKIIGKFLFATNKKYLVTLDKFDDYYDRFYEDLGIGQNDARSKEGEWIKSRKIFLKSILEGLILAARDLKKVSEFEWIDTLFTIPMDKFLELHLRAFPLSRDKMRRSRQGGVFFLSSSDDSKKYDRASTGSKPSDNSCN